MTIRNGDGPEVTPRRTNRTGRALLEKDNVHWADTLKASIFTSHKKGVMQD
jgi:hypothetical protein